MRRGGGVLFVLAFVLSSFLLGGRASAGGQWCEEDPEFLVNGGIVDISTFFAADIETVQGPVTFDLHVPRNATAAALRLPGTVPVTATISRDLPSWYGVGWMPVFVTVNVRATTSFDTTTTITGTQGRLASAI